MSKTRNFFWPAAQSSQLLEFVAREKNFSGIYINLLTFLGARPHLRPTAAAGRCREVDWARAEIPGVGKG